MTISQEKNITANREAWIDYLRGTGIILMIIGHSYIWRPIITWVYGFHMPLFFILSGYLFNKEKWECAGFKSFVAVRFRNFIIPYLIWCGICFVINLPLLYYSHHNDNLVSALVQNLGWIITSVRIDGIFLPQNCTPLWFLTCFFISQQVFYWLVRCKTALQFVLSAFFIATNFLMNYFKIPILPWHFEVALIGSVFLLVGYYFKQKCLLNTISSPFVIVGLMILSSVVILSNGRANIYYRNYGNNLLIFIFGSILMSYSFMWLCKSTGKLYFNRIICNLGTYSIIPMGLNYTINIYTRGIYQILGKISGIDMHWVEYILIIINIAICMIVIGFYKKLVLRDKKFQVLVGR